MISYEAYSCHQYRGQVRRGTYSQLLPHNTMGHEIELYLFCMIRVLGIDQFQIYNKKSTIPAYLVFTEYTLDYFSFHKVYTCSCSFDIGIGF